MLITVLEPSFSCARSSNSFNCAQGRICPCYYFYSLVWHGSISWCKIIFEVMSIPGNCPGNLKRKSHFILQKQNLKPNQSERKIAKFSPKHFRLLEIWKLSNPFIHFLPRPNWKKSRHVLAKN